MSQIPQPWLQSLPEKRVATMQYEEIMMYEFLKRRAGKDPNDLMVIFPKGRTISYSQMVSFVERFAAFLQHIGVKKGDKVALLLPNTPHYIIGHFAIQLIGGIVVQANPLYTEHELIQQLTDAEAVGIVSLTMFQDKVNVVLERSPMKFAVYGQIQTYLKSTVKILGKLLKKSIFNPKGRTYDAPFVPRENTYFFDEIINNSYELQEVPIDFAHDIAIFQYTGGTTGVPKAAMLTHRNISVNAQQARAVIHIVPEKQGSLLTVLPMFHVFGMTACLNISIMLGIPLVLNIASPPDFGDILKWIERYKVSFFPAVPAMLTAIYSHPNAAKTDFSSLITVISGGAPLPGNVCREFVKLTNANVVEGYGLSETSPLVFGGSPEIQNPIGSIGLPSPDTNAKIVDPDDYNTIMPLGKVGELCVKGPQIMKGYWHMKDETEEVLKSDGWFKTGDIAYMDEKGYAYIVDRKKDLIIVSGYNVVPREVEEIIYKHPSVLECAVAGLQHPKKGEIVAAWIVLREGKSATESEILEFCRNYLAPYKLPKSVIFKEELPKSMVGKILRKELQKD